jgi:hypothetical protein
VAAGHVKDISPLKAIRSATVDVSVCVKNSQENADCVPKVIGFQGNAKDVPKTLSSGLRGM